jgi:hypothetical protein
MGVTNAGKSSTEGIAIAVIPALEMKTAVDIRGATVMMVGIGKPSCG